MLEHGEKFSFQDHRYLFEMYDEHHPHIVLEKSAQMGLTTWAFIKSIYHCINTFNLGVIYFFPTKTDVLDFSRGRIKPFIKYNSHMKIVDEDDVDNVSLKRIGKALIYFRGMKSDTGMKSVPSDMNIYDEIDEADPQSKDLADKRMEHSKFKWQIELSNPTIENYGIDRSFQESDQRYWNIKCSHCNTWNVLELNFPGCLLRNKDGRVIRACKKCKKEIDLDGKAQWVAKYPSRKKKRGYHISNLFSKFARPIDILDAYEKIMAGELYKLETFWRLVIGKAYTSGQNKLSKEDILKCERAQLTLGLRDKLFVGVDQGNHLHAVTTKKLKDGKVGLMELMVYKDFDELDKIMKDKHTMRMVIDALPETREAKRLAFKYPGRVYLNYYNEHQKGSYKWKVDEEKNEYTVSVNRTESLDASTSIIRSGNLVISKSIDEKTLDIFAEQCANLARKKETKDDGSQRYVYVRLGPDHFRHAFNYGEIAGADFVEAAHIDVKALLEKVSDAPSMVSANPDW